jgi:hypothetical protein
MLARYDKTWPPARALLLVYSAKARAEHTTTVGERTDITVIRPGNVIQLPVPEDSIFHQISKRRLEKEAAAEREAYTELEQYIKQSAQAGDSRGSNLNDPPPDVRSPPTEAPPDDLTSS